VKEIFVYGSLKKGEYNHYLLECKEAKFLREGFLHGYTIYDIGHSYPAATRSEKQESFITGEIYEVSEDLFLSILRMEVGAAYTLDCVDGLYIFWMPKDIISHYKNNKDIGGTWSGKRRS
jgi:gamma-glutamylcyclotransferase (GGCT)/AIG2-like uncharacterized protein YtfP